MTALPVSIGVDDDAPVPFALTPAALQAVPDRPRSWIRRIIGGGWTEEVCPAWCTRTHVNDQNGASNRDDLTHATTDVSTKVEMRVAGAGAGVAAWPILAARIEADPYSEYPAWRAPHVTFEPSVDDVVEVMDPDAFAAVIADIRAHCDRLDQVHAQLVQLRAEYERVQA